MPTWFDAKLIDIFVNGLWLTLLLTVVTSLLSLLVGVGAGMLRLSERRWLRLLGAIHVEIHRNVPALVLIIFWAFAIPNLFPVDARQQIFFDNDAINWLSKLTGIPLVYYALAVVIALTLNTSAYIAELFRAGVGTIERETIEEAQTLGASQRVTFFQFLLPLGLRAAFPAIATRLIHNMKNTSLAAFVSVPELFQSMQTGISLTFHATELLLVTAVIYLLLALCMSVLFKWIEQLLVQKQPSPARQAPRGRQPYLQTMVFTDNGGA